MGLVNSCSWDGVRRLRRSLRVGESTQKSANKRTFRGSSLVLDFSMTLTRKEKMAFVLDIPVPVIQRALGNGMLTPSCRFHGRDT